MVEKIVDLIGNEIPTDSGNKITDSTRIEAESVLDHKGVVEAYSSLKDIECPYFCVRYSSKNKVKPEVSKAHLEELKKMLSIISCNPHLEFRPGDQLRSAWEILILETQEYSNLCSILGAYIHYGGDMILQGKANENFRGIYPKAFGIMPKIWKSEDENITQPKKSLKKRGW